MAAEITEYNERAAFMRRENYSRHRLTTLNKDGQGPLLNHGDNTGHSATKLQHKKKQSRRDSSKNRGDQKEQKAGQRQVSGARL